MKEKINRYIHYMKEKHGVTAAMVTGSYVSNTMGPNSDIDIFFIWDQEFKTMRGREYFEDQEFEYFISPEWKFYDRLKTDKVSMRIYSSALILFDPDNKLSKIKKVAKTQIESIQHQLNEEQKREYLFWLDTIQTDGEGLFDKKEYANFVFFTGFQLSKMVQLLCLLKNKLPIYEKYGSEETKEIDLEFGMLMETFLLLKYEDANKKSIWIKLCKHLMKELGDNNIKEFQKVQKL